MKLIKNYKPHDMPHGHGISSRYVPNEGMYHVVQLATYGRDTSIMGPSLPQSRMQHIVWSGESYVVLDGRSMSSVLVHGVRASNTRTVRGLDAEPHILIHFW